VSLTLCSRESGELQGSVKLRPEQGELGADFTDLGDRFAQSDPLRL
jgi:hypothetical protein